MTLLIRPVVLQTTVTVWTVLGLIRGHGTGPVLKKGFPSRKQLSLTEENFSFCFSFFSNIPGSGKTISNEYFKVFILCDFCDELRR